MPMDLRLYPKDWKTISLRIRERESWRCKRCGIAQGDLTARARQYDLQVKVVLTVAHIGAPHPDGRPGDKHDKFDCRDENLEALCQRCHLHEDMDDHVRNARATRTAKRLHLAEASGQGLLFKGIAE